MSRIPRQKTFDIVSKHLLTQNAKSLDQDRCRYRGPCDRRCALGPLIPDDLYGPQMENCTIFTVGSSGDDLRAAICYSLSVEELDEDDKDFLNTLQLIHDSTHPNVWREQLTTFALLRKLEMKT